MVLRLGCLISGRGSNLQALIDACAAPDFPAEIALVLSNKADAEGLARAKAAGLATLVIDHKTYPDRESFDAEMDRQLRAAGVELVCLAGFMRLLTDGFVGAWRDRMINIHPSLLPLFKGTHTHRQALQAGVAEHGCSVHFVVPELDAGPVILQAKVPVLPGDDEETLAKRVLVEEHKLYPAALAEVASGRARLEGGAVIRG